MDNVRQYKIEATLGVNGAPPMPGIASIVESVFHDDVVLISFVLRFRDGLPKTGKFTITPNEPNCLLFSDGRTAIVHVVRMTTEWFAGVGNIGVVNRSEGPLDPL